MINIILNYSYLIIVLETICEQIELLMLDRNT